MVGSQTKLSDHRIDINSKYCRDIGRLTVHVRYEPIRLCLFVVFFYPFMSLLVCLCPHGELGKTCEMVRTASREVELHRREMLLDRKLYTVLSPRPTSPFRFATNLYHDTWHVLSDARGAHLLGRMFWSMAYQRKPNTIMVIDYPLLVTNPFDADQSSPILMSNTNLGGLSKTAIAQLKRNLPFTSPSSVSRPWCRRRPRLENGCTRSPRIANSFRPNARPCGRHRRLRNPARSVSRLPMRR